MPEAGRKGISFLLDRHGKRFITGMPFACLLFFLSLFFSCGKNNHYQQGLVYFKNGNYDDALREFQWEIHLHPLNPNAYFNMGIIWSLKNQYDEALKHFEMAERCAGEFPEALYYQCLTLLQKGRDFLSKKEFYKQPEIARSLFRDAMDRIEKFLKKRPGYAPSLEIRARIHLALADFYLFKGDSILSDFFGPSIEVHIKNLFRKLVYEDGSQEAMDAFKESLTEKQPFPEFPQLERTIKNAQKAFLSAIGDFQEALSKDKELASARLTLARIFMDQQKENEAVRLCEEILAISKEKLKGPVEEDVDYHSEANLLLLYGLDGAGRSEEGLQKAFPLLRYYLEKDPKNPAIIVVRTLICKFYYKLEKYDETIAEADLGLKKFPNSPYLKKYKGQALHQKGKYTESIKVLEEICSILVNDFESHYIIGLAYYKVGLAQGDPQFYPKALQNLTIALNLQYANLQAHFDRIQVFLAMEWLDDAKDSTERLIQLDKANKEAHRILRKLEKDIPARGSPEISTPDQAWEALRFSPNNPYPYLRLAELYWKGGEEEKALEAVQVFNRIVLRSYAGQMLEGQILYKKGLYIQAFRRFEIAKNVQRWLPDPYAWAGNSLLKGGERLLDALAFFEEALAFEPEDQEIALAIAETCVLTHRYSGAKKMAAKLLEADPQNRRALYILGSALLGEESYEEAVEAFLKIPMEGSPLPYFHLNLGRAFLGAGSTEEAMVEFEKAKNRNPDYPPAVLAPVEVILKNRGIRAAMDELEVYYKEHPDEPYGLFMIGKLCLLLGELERADNFMERVAKAVPDFPEGHLYWGLTEYKAGRFVEASCHFERALELMPENPAIRLYLAKICWKKNKIEEAFQKISEAEALRPGNPEPFIVSGEIHLSLWNLGDAEKRLRDALEKFPRHPKINFLLGESYRLWERHLEALSAYWEAFSALREKEIEEEEEKELFSKIVYRLIEVAFRAGHHQKGLEVLGSHSSRLQADELSYLLALFYFMVDEHAKSRNICNSLIKKNPKSWEVRILLAQNQEKLKGEAKKASDQYARLASLEEKDPQLAMPLARYYFSKGRFPFVSGILNPLYRQFKKAPHLGILIARSLIGAQQENSAIEVLQEVDSLSLDRVAGISLMRCYLEKNDLNAAQEVAERYLSAFSGNPVLLSGMAIVHLERKEYGEAEEDLDKIPLRDRGFASTWISLAIALAQGNLELLLEKLSSSSPDPLIALLKKEMGSVLESLKKEEETRLNLAQCIARSVHFMDSPEWGKTVEKYVLRITSLLPGSFLEILFRSFISTDRENLIRLFKEFVKTHGKSPSINYLLAKYEAEAYKEEPSKKIAKNPKKMEIFKKRQIKTKGEAISFYYKVMYSGGFRVVPLLLEAAEFLASTEEYERAEEILDRTLRLYPEDGSLYAARAKLYFLKGEGEKGFEVLKKANEHNVFPPLETLALAKMQSDEGKIQEGCSLLEKLTLQNPDFCPAWKILGEFYEKLGDLERARVSFSKALELDPLDLPLYRRLGEVLVAAGERESALQELQKLLLFEESDPELLVFLARIASGDPKTHGEALEYLKKARDLQEKKKNTSSKKMAEFSLSFGEIYFQMEKFEDAEKELLFSLKKSPKNPEVLFLLSKIALKQGKNDQARTLLNRILQLKVDFPKREEVKRLLEDLKEEGKKESSPPEEGKEEPRKKKPAPIHGYAAPSLLDPPSLISSSGSSASLCFLF